MTDLKEALFYRTSDADINTVECFLCNHRCRIRDGKRGLCNVRKNEGGRLYALTYGRLIAGSPDVIEKKPLYHFLPGTLAYSLATPGCNFRCPWCQNWQISRTDASADISRLPYTAPETVVENALKSGCQSISYTYTEPTIFMEFALDTARVAHENGLKNSFVTNGYESPEAIDEMSGLVDAANIDLKSFSGEMYRNECRADLDKVLESIRKMHEAGIHLEITTLLIPGKNDSQEEITALVNFIATISKEIPWHVSRFHPDFQTTDIGPTPVSTIERAIETGHEAGLNYIYAGNIDLPEGGDTACPNCGTLLIKRRGMGFIASHLDNRRCGNCGQKINVVN